jgi:hypothetical protein
MEPVAWKEEDMTIAYVPNNLIGERDKESWRLQWEELAADREFRKVRIQAHWRRLAIFLGLEAHHPASARPRSYRFDVDINDMAGLIHDDGRLEVGIPVLPQGLARKWRTAFMDPAYDNGDDEAFSFRMIGYAWYLEGGFNALLRLELMRLRGELRVRGVLSPVHSVEGFELKSEECCDEDEACSLAC